MITTLTVSALNGLEVPFKNFTQKGNNMEQDGNLLAMIALVKLMEATNTKTVTLTGDDYDKYYGRGIEFEGHGDTCIVKPMSIEETTLQAKKQIMQEFAQTIIDKAINNVLEQEKEDVDNSKTTPRS